MSGFESSFPAIDTSNEVSNAPASPWHPAPNEEVACCDSPHTPRLPPQNTSSLVRHR
jgi:hypothetical protein